MLPSMPRSVEINTSKNAQMLPDQHVVEHASDDVPELLFGNFLPDVDEIERTDG
jgi:hypothetical protein